MNTTTASYDELTKNVSNNLATLRADIPEVMKGFNDLARAATSNSALDKKTKELIALALGGATKAEVEEALGMAVYMGGGPSLMYSANAVAAFEEFSEAAMARPTLRAAPQSPA